MQRSYLEPRHPAGMIVKVFLAGIKVVFILLNPNQLALSYAQEGIRWFLKNVCSQRIRCMQIKGKGARFQ